MTDLQVWIDIETTGLSAQLDKMLEIGLIITDKSGKEIASWESLIQDDNFAWQSRVYEVENAENGTTDQFVRDMHRKSGLWDELQDPNAGLTVRNAEFAAITFLNDNGVTPQTVPLFGSSIGSLDRPFVLTHMPNLNEWMSYRNMDNSSLKILCNSHRPDLAAKRDELFGSSSSTDHRVLEDCRFSIAEYQFYLKHFLKATQPKKRVVKDA